MMLGWMLSNVLVWSKTLRKRRKMSVCHCALFADTILNTCYSRPTAAVSRKIRSLSDYPSDAISRRSHKRSKKTFVLLWRYECSRVSVKDEKLISKFPVNAAICLHFLQACDSTRLCRHTQRLNSSSLHGTVTICHVGDFIYWKHITWTEV